MRRLAIECLEKRYGLEKRKACGGKVDDGRLNGRALEVREIPYEKRHLEGRVFGDFEVNDFDGIKPRRLKGHLVGRPPSWETKLGRSDDDFVRSHVLVENDEAHGVIGKNTEVNRLVCKIRGDVQKAPQTTAKRRRSVIDEEVTTSRFALRKCRVDEITVARFCPRGIVVGKVKRRAENTFDAICCMFVDEPIARFQENGWRAE